MAFSSSRSIITPTSLEIFGSLVNDICTLPNGTFAVLTEDIKNKDHQRIAIYSSEGALLLSSRELKEAPKEYDLHPIPSPMEIEPNNVKEKDKKNFKLWGITSIENYIVGSDLEGKRQYFFDAITLDLKGSMSAGSDYKRLTIRKAVKRPDSVKSYITFDYNNQPGIILDFSNPLVPTWDNVIHYFGYVSGLDILSSNRMALIRWRSLDIEVAGVSPIRLVPLPSDVPFYFNFLWNPLVALAGDHLAVIREKSKDKIITCDIYNIANQECIMSTQFETNHSRFNFGTMYNGQILYIQLPVKTKGDKHTVHFLDFSERKQSTLIFDNYPKVLDNNIIQFKHSALGSSLIFNNEKELKAHCEAVASHLNPAELVQLVTSYSLSVDFSFFNNAKTRETKEVKETELVPAEAKSIKPSRTFFQPTQTSCVVASAPTPTPNPSSSFNRSDFVPPPFGFL